MSASVFTKSIENLSYELESASSKRRFPLKIVALICGIGLLLGLFVFQQVRVEVALWRTESVEDHGRNILTRLGRLENATSGALTKLTELHARMNSTIDWILEKNSSAAVVAETVTKLDRGSSFQYPMGLGRCGGYLVLEPGMTNLSYGVPSDGEAHWCVWAVRSRMTGKMVVTRLDLSEPDSWRHYDLSLGVALNTAPGDCNYFNLLTTTTLNFDNPFVLVFFYGLLSTGFRLGLNGGNGIGTSPKAMSFVREIPPFTYKFPYGTGNYAADQLFALVVTPKQGQAVRVNVTDIHTEACCDWVSLMWMGYRNHFDCLKKSGLERGSISATDERETSRSWFSSPPTITELMTASMYLVKFASKTIRRQNNISY